MKKLMKRSLIARLLATVAVTGLIALYLLNVISTGTRMSSTRQKINLCKSRNPRPSKLMVWDFCFHSAVYQSTGTRFLSLGHQFSRINSLKESPSRSA